MIMPLERLVQPRRAAFLRRAEADLVRLALLAYAPVDIPSAMARMPVLKAGGRPIIGA
jgi:hypothetical protein